MLKNNPPFKKIKRLGLSALAAVLGSSGVINGKRNASDRHAAEMSAKLSMFLNMATGRGGGVIRGAEATAFLRMVQRCLPEKRLLSMTKKALGDGVITRGEMFFLRRAMLLGKRRV